jgi:hypothetical protein
LDVEAAGVAIPDLPEEQRHGFDVDGVQLLFRGTCGNCLVAD